MGLETTQKSYTKLFLCQGKRGKEAAAKVILPQCPLPTSGKLMFLSFSTGQCRLTTAARPPYGHMPGTHRRVLGKSFGTRGPTESEMDTLSPLTSTVHQRVLHCSMHRALQRLWGDVWIKCTANGSARLEAWWWKHLATLLQTRLACDCPPWSSARWLRNANVLRVTASVVCHSPFLATCLH